MNVAAVATRLVHDLEIVDACCCADFTCAAPASIARNLGLGLLQRGGTVAMRAAAIDVLALNRVIGFGVAEPATEVLLDEMVEFYGTAAVPRFFVQLSPTPQAPELVAWLSARGFTHHNSWAKLSRAVHEPPALETSLRIERIATSHASAFAALLTTAFGMPEAARSWLAASVGLPRWLHYFAFDGDEPVATAVLYIHGDVGWLGYACTAESHRGRGAQSALIAQRIRDAREHGCRLLVAETAEDRPDRRAPSFHNLRRLGFELAYVRPNYLWKDPTASR